MLHHVSAVATSSIRAAEDWNTKVHISFLLHEWPQLKLYLIYFMFRGLLDPNTDSAG